jgi:hypothetical protein
MNEFVIEESLDFPSRDAGEGVIVTHPVRLSKRSVG